ncbi:hypothetical protein CC77DRAFT_1005036 [Alternaria alternata]|uniref:Uncharacterized protein n=1 Tax=Alternaria alternata TaxID=5599 RepID=A0A177E0B9_ALTAL|nr:hypothetical protein CC77DRAFT_1005036 [Alternaria alternata]KAH6841624.1 hypothetical protein B0T12DRAFT_398929 [Alternaria alternata]OAG25424.1 hypothetical protein CC77DRAFT_1005036 [Alternaria alternata]
MACVRLSTPSASLMIFTGVCDTAGSRKHSRRIREANIHGGLPEDEASGRCGTRRRWNTAYPTGCCPSYGYCKNGASVLNHQHNAVLRRIQSTNRMRKTACTPMHSHHQADYASIAPAHLDRSNSGTGYNSSRRLDDIFPPDASASGFTCRWRYTKRGTSDMAACTAYGDTKG